jgi:hypothetical protein
VKDTKRLGPQNPLNWIRDSRESPAQPSKPGEVERSISYKKQTYRFQSDGESPVEVIVVMNGDRAGHQVRIEVAQEGKKAMNVEFKTSNDQK